MVSVWEKDWRPAAMREFPGKEAAKSAKEASRVKLLRLLRLSSEESRFELPSIPMFPKEAVLGKIVPEEGRRFIKT